MKILLFSPANSDLINAVSVPLGLISIGTYLKNAGHNIKIVDMAVSHISVVKVLREYKPDICGVSVRSSKSVRFALDISKKIRKYNSTIPIVWGGPFCGNAPIELFFETGVIDIICFGEGEITWLDLADYVDEKKELDKIKGIAYKKHNNIIQTDEREFIDLYKVLPADWSLVDVPKYFQYLYGSKKLLYLYYAKGCPAKCTFCYNPYFHRSCYRKKKLETFMFELKQLVENYGLDGFYLADEIAFPQKKDLYEFCDALDNLGVSLRWGCQTRIGAVDKESLRRMYDSGCRWIDFGIESGSKKMLNKIKKNIDYDKIIPTFEWCDEIGLISMTNIIVGLHEETTNDLIESVQIINKIKATTATFGFYCYNFSSEMGWEIYNSGKYTMPTRLADYNKNDFFVNTFPNFSTIPLKDKKVVQGYFMWQQLLKKDISSDTNKFELFFKHIVTVLHRLPYIGLKHIPEALVKTFFPFVRFFIAGNFYKKTLKRYGIE